MAALGALAQLPYPQPVAQAGAPFGQVHGHHLTVGQTHSIGSELLLRPILAGEFVVGQAGDVLGFHAIEKRRRIALAVEHQGEAMAQRIGLQLPIRRGGQALLDARHDLLLDDLDQHRVDHLIDDKKGLTVHGVDPVVGGGPLTQALAGDIVARPLCG